MRSAKLSLTIGLSLVLIGLVFAQDPCADKHGDLLPDPQDCGKFYQCVWGSGAHLKCPPGLHFNHTIKVCDWPHHVNCKAAASNSTTVPPDNPGEIAETTTSTTNATSGPTTTSTTTEALDAENSTLTTSETSPASEGPDESSSIATESSGTDTTPDIDESLTIQTSNPEGTESTIGDHLDTESDESEIGDGSGDSGISEKNCEKANHGDLTPDPDDCEYFRQCVWGRSVRMPCPKGLHFNPILKVCDDPQDAQCLTEIDFIPV